MPPGFGEAEGLLCEPLRDLAQSRKSRSVSFGEWFVFLLAFLFAMAWGVLAAFAVEGQPQPSAPSQSPRAATSQASPGGAVPPRSRPSAGPALASFKPALLVYRQAEGEGFKKPGGVFVDRETGEVLVVDSGSNLVSVLSRDGIPLYSFGYNGEVRQPSQAVTDKRGRILVLAGVPRKVKVFNYRGEPLADFDFPGFEGAARVLPTALTVDRAGNLYVADSTSGKILVYDLDDRLVMSFGGRGEGPGTFSSVTAMTVDQAGTIYVADAQHRPAIQVFDAKASYVRGWGEHSAGPMNFSLPSGIAVDALGRVLVADTIRQTIAVFTSEGSYLFRFGGLGAFPGDLAYPSSIAVDGMGRLYVTEAVNARLQVFELTEGAATPRAAAQPAPAVPSRAREELRRGLGEVLKDIQGK